MPELDLPLLFRNAAGQLREDPTGFLRTDWSAQPRALADTQALFNRMSGALHQREWSKILINQIEMPPFSPAEQQWITQEWLPPAVRDSGYRYGAVVVSANIFARLATAFITTNVQGLPLRYRSFDQEPEAAAWLRQQPG